MKAITMYESFDGYRFNTPEACLAYEKEKHDVADARVKVAKELCEKFYPGESLERFQPVSPEAIINLREGSPTVQGLAINIIADGKALDGNALEDLYHGKKTEFSVIFDSVSDFRTTKFGTFEEKWEKHLPYSNGPGLAKDINFALYPIDVAVLAKIHQSGKYRQRIETLLKCCQCEEVARDFHHKKYDNL